MRSFATVPNVARSRNGGNDSSNDIAASAGIIDSTLELVLLVDVLVL
jgi:hypothetical protein